mgnify:CR=1 FL=1
MKDEHGVHVESVLTALGALAGYAWQMGVSEGLVKTGGVSAGMGTSM